MSRQALEGLKVIDIGNIVAGPFTATLLADFGAEVIKVEAPSGDLIRSMGSVTDMWYAVEGRNKKNITLNLKSEKGKEILWKLIENADVLVENFRTGAFERLGFSWEELHNRNPKLVYVTASGYGRTGKYANKPGFDRLGAGLGGLISITGYPDRPPVKTAISITDYYTALFACNAVMFALYDRDINKSGEGQMIDVSLAETTLRIQETILAEYSYNGKVRKRTGNGSTVAIPSGHFETKDGKYVAVAIAGQKLFDELMNRIGRSDVLSNPKYQTGADRTLYRDELNEIFANWAKEKTLQEILDLCGNDLPVGPLYDVEDIFNDDYFTERDDLVKLNTEEFGEITMQGIVPKMSATPGEVKWEGKKQGSFNGEIYSALGFSREEQEKLKAEGII